MGREGISSKKMKLKITGLVLFFLGMSALYVLKIIKSLALLVSVGLGVLCVVFIYFKLRRN